MDCSEQRAYNTAQSRSPFKQGWCEQPNMLWDVQPASSNKFSLCAAQVNLLVLHEAFSPSTPRLLREAAALLSPQTVSMPVQQAEHVTPITGGGSSRAEQQPKALYASILQLANTGVCMLSCVVCLAVLTVRFSCASRQLAAMRMARVCLTSRGAAPQHSCCLLNLFQSHVAAVQASQQQSWPS
jgi:hypothetical protein